MDPLTLAIIIGGGAFLVASMGGKEAPPQTGDTASCAPDEVIVGGACEPKKDPDLDSAPPADDVGQGVGSPGVTAGDANASNPTGATDMRAAVGEQSIRLVAVGEQLIRPGGDAGVKKETTQLLPGQRVEKKPSKPAPMRTLPYFRMTRARQARELAAEFHNPLSESARQGFFV